MFDKISQTLYINNVRLGGIIEYMFGIRGVDIHSQLRLIFIIATHQLNTYTIDPKPSPHHLSTIHISPSNRSLTVHLPFATLPLFLIILFPLIYTYYTTLKFYKKHIPHSKYPYSQSEFFKLPIDKYLKIYYTILKQRKEV